MEQFLAYGAIGLGLALAILAYRLLSKEQERPGNARAPVLRAIYVFMAFSLVLVGGGLVKEYLGSEGSKIGEVRADLEKARSELEALQEKHQNMSEGVNVSSAVMESLMHLKVGKVTRLKGLNPSEPAYAQLVQEIVADLEQFDTGLKKALEK